jgi:hypothetical protein
MFGIVLKWSAARAFDKLARLFVVKYYKNWHSMRVNKIRSVLPNG